MPELVFFRRGEEVLRFGLDRPRTVLGRGEKSDVVIPDPQVSRQQVAIQFDGAQVSLEDLSGRGTLVSGLPPNARCCPMARTFRSDTGARCTGNAAGRARMP